MMASENESRCQLTNDFSLTLSILVEGDIDIEEKSPRLGLSSIIPLKHKLIVSFLLLFLLSIKKVALSPFNT